MSWKLIYAGGSEETTVTPLLVPQCDVASKKKLVPSLEADWKDFPTHWFRTMAILVAGCFMAQFVVGMFQYFGNGFLTMEIENPKHSKI